MPAVYSAKAKDKIQDNNIFIGKYPARQKYSFLNEKKPEIIPDLIFLYFFEDANSCGKFFVF
jgi:hypothetical protein